MLKTPTFRLNGKRALIVGASSGIGQGCAVALGEYGAHVTLAARRKDALLETAEMIKDVNGVSDLLPMDILQFEQSQKLILENGPFDILINAAGYARHTSAIETTLADYDDVADINMKGAYFVTRAVAQGLIAANKGGSLINISSQMGHVGGIERTVYSATKHAIEGMTKSMAIEWAPNQIRVNTICPTFIRTELAEQTLAIPERRKWIEEKIKLGRVGEIEDIMGAAVFLASDASSLITGTSILIDGGWTAG